MSVFEREVISVPYETANVFVSGCVCVCEKYRMSWCLRETVYRCQRDRRDFLWKGPCLRERKRGREKESKRKQMERRWRTHESI